ncbi:MAG: VTT domain-containing protein [Rhabdochlamydiaceae bacterium]|nr:VTT domain-containing protein [Rhabdochlamydiaceae bacterium]
MFNAAKKLYEWASSKAKLRLAPLWLGVIFLTELIFFIPMDAILLLFCLENPARRYYYAAMATLASAITGTIGYFLGHIAWDFLQPYILDHLISTAFFNRITEHYLAIQNWAVFCGAFLPVPYKAITLSAGVCHLSFVPFLGAILTARILRFFLIAKATEKWGLQIKAFIDKHFHRFVVGIGIKIAFALSFFWALS